LSPLRIRSFFLSPPLNARSSHRLASMLRKSFLPILLFTLVVSTQAGWINNLAPRRSPAAQVCGSAADCPPYLNDGISLNLPDVSYDLGDAIVCQYYISDYDQEYGCYYVKPDCTISNDIGYALCTGYGSSYTKKRSDPAAPVPAPKRHSEISAAAKVRKALGDARHV